MPDNSVKYLHQTTHTTRDDAGRVEYIGAVQDVTERELSEQALDKIRSELAHVVRATSLGALTASIAHEVNQPLSGIMTNAATGLRMLDATPPDIAGARETARRTLRDANRASGVISQLRALFSRREFTVEPLDLNEAAPPTLKLARYTAIALMSASGRGASESTTWAIGPAAAPCSAEWPVRR